MGFDLGTVRDQFPILERRIRTLDGRERPLIYLDHGASTHAPRPVIDEVVRTLEHSYANIHRGHHTLSTESSDRFDAALRDIMSFVGARPEASCAVLGQNTTMVLDIAAHVMADVPGATLTTAAEHHSNDLPHRKRGEVLHANVDAEGRILLDDVREKLEANHVKLLAVTGASNVTGFTPPIHKLARLAHENGARILVDAAQLYAHRAIDVKPLGHPEHLDFLAAAGHKSYAPLGSAVLVADRDALDAAPPYMPGGGTVEWVTDDSALYSKSPERHMGGTPNIVGALAFATATRWLAKLGMDNVAEHERDLVVHALRRFSQFESQCGVRLLGPQEAKEKVGVFAFVVPGVRHEIVSMALDHEFGIATRDGCFCAHPLLQRLLGLGDTAAWRSALERGEKILLPGAARASLGIYNSTAELDAFFEGLEVVARKKWKGEYTLAGQTFEPGETGLAAPPAPQASRRKGAGRRD